MLPWEISTRKRPDNNKSSLVDNSQPLTFLTMESQATTVTLLPFSFFFFFCFALLLCLYWSYFMSSFLRFTCRDDILAVTLFDNLSLSLLHSFVSLSSESMITSYLFLIINVSSLSFIAIFNWVPIFWYSFLYFYNYLPTFHKKKNPCY